ncbi:phosphatase PAP2 family protein [Fusobacterium sp. IOR10]|uniref:phosphatase PAP2 family protein n=1 Tax=Fusobacterium sp. IOR10 TaxID=2665157 RepID=UPI0013D3B55E|nr:phosphatase PAP2 family protein [Fusobacterium sp. IOR10]
MSFLNLLRNYRTPFWNEIWNLITKLGEGTTVIVVICIIYWCLNKKLGKILGYIFFISSLVVQGLKIGCRIERPWIIDPNFKAVSLALKNATGYSFPSGHSQSSTSIFGGLAFYFRSRILKIFFILIPMLVCFSRLYLGVHTPKDVIVGFLITFIIAFVVIKYTKAYNRYQRIELMIITFILGSILLIYSFLLYIRNVIDVEYLVDCFKIIGSSFGFILGNYLEGNFVKFRVKTIRIWEQLVKIIFGLLGLLLLNEFFKLLSNLLGFKSLIVYGVEYFILMLWIVYIWPMIFKKILK